MLKATGERRIDTIFVLIIFCIFALSVLAVLMLGATVYKNMSEITRDGQAERMFISYIWTKVKNRDDSGSVYIGTFAGLPALCFDEEYSGTKYRTVVYHYNGWAYELFSEVGLDFSPQDGIRVVEIDEFSFANSENGLIEILAGTRSLLINPRGSSRDTF